jgi:hypothetical protein
MRLLALVVGLGLAGLTAVHGHAQPFDFDMSIESEIAAANDALSHAHDNLGGMNGLGVIPEPDLSTIHEMLSAGEEMLRDARRRAQAAKTPQEQIWVVGYARSAKAMIEAAFEYKTKRGYQ